MRSVAHRTASKALVRSRARPSISARAPMGAILNRYGEIKERMTRQFVERLERESSVDRLDQCFPFPVLAVEAPVLEFYDFYGI